MPRISETYCTGVRGKASFDENLKTQFCSLKNGVCDGGGNRYASNINVSNSALRNIDINSSEICSSVCSIDATGDTNWIVCPRRLLCFDRNDDADPQKKLKDFLYFESALSGTVAVWKEVKLKSSLDGIVFDYTFDFVIAEFDPGRLEVLSSPIIIEVMTSSTSGGNKSKGTTIPQSFENLMLGKEHTAPGINYRQVWGRMISQFFVKSQVASAWGGKTFWVIQDSLAKYIETTTGFDFEKKQIRKFR